MNRLFILGLLIALAGSLFAQDEKTVLQNSADKILEDNPGLSVSGYTQIDYNQPFGNDYKTKGKLDVHRMVMMFGYKFNEKTSFISEIEYEHVKEVYIEQAFLNHKINNYLNFRAGLLLIPMGIINEYHEPTTYNGVERPNLDSKIVPSTWREIGAGFSGNFIDLSLKYQLYVVNGFSGYDADAKFNGSKGFRSGRQKGAESFMSSPNLSGKIDFYGISGLNLGLAGYFGKSQSSLFDGSTAEDVADSSVVGISMVGVDARYNKNGFQLRGQLNYVSISEATTYNEFSGSDLADAMFGYYVEAGYNIFQTLETETELTPFVRYESYNTHHKTSGDLATNPAYKRTEITAGIGWKLAKGAVLKADMQLFSNDASDETNKQFNLGVGIWF